MFLFNRFSNKYTKHASELDTPKLSEFTIKINTGTTPLTQHQIYQACKEYGLIVSCIAGYNSIYVTFERSKRTDSLKPMHTINVGATALILKWTRDYQDSRPLKILPLDYQPDKQSPFDKISDDVLSDMFVLLAEIDQNAIDIMASVCRRFEAVIETFKPKYVKVTDDSYKPLWKLENFFRVFGTRMEAINIAATGCSDIILVFVAKYCTKVFEMHGSIHFRNTTLELGALFPQPYGLTIHGCNRSDIMLKLGAHIRTLRIGPVDDLPPVRLSRLRDFTVCIEGKNERSIEQFFALNRQIEVLQLDDQYFNRDSIPFAFILENLRNLADFRSTGLSLSPRIIAAFGRLENLRALELDQIDGSVVEMLAAFVRNDVKLRRLILQEKSSNTDLVVGQLIQMKSLELLNVELSNDDELERIVRNNESLTDIVITSSNITPRGILSAMRGAHHIKKAKFYIYFCSTRGNEVVDQRNEIDAIAELRRRRKINIEVRLNFDDCTLNNGELWQTIGQITKTHKRWLTKTEYTPALYNWNIYLIIILLIVIFFTILFILTQKKPLKFIRIGGRSGGSTV